MLYSRFNSLRIHLQGLQVGPFPGHYLSQQLFFQAHRSHCEVDEGGLGLELRREMGIGQLGVEDELKVTVVLTLLAPNSNVTG